MSVAAIEELDEKQFLSCVKKINKTCVLNGEGGRKPSEGSVCSIEMTVHFISTTPSSNIFSTPYSTFAIGDGDGWEDRTIEYCVTTMTIGEKSNFSLDSDYLSFSVSITLTVCFFKPYTFQMSDCEKIELALRYKERGIVLYKSAQIISAFYKFSQAIKLIITLQLWYLTENEDNNALENCNFDDVVTLRINLYNNMALCHFQCKHYQESVMVCFKSLKMQTNVKALYRRAVAYIELFEYDKAEVDLVNLLKIEPSNKAALEKLTLTRELDKDNRLKYATTVKKMFKP